MNALNVKGVTFYVRWHWEKAGRDSYKTGAHTRCSQCGSSMDHVGERVVNDYMTRHAASHVEAENIP